MRPRFLEAFLRKSSLGVVPPTSNSAQNGLVRIPRELSGQPAGSPDEAYPEKRQPHDAICRILCAQRELAEKEILSSHYLSLYKKKKQTEDKLR